MKILSLYLRFFALIMAIVICVSAAACSASVADDSVVTTDSEVPEHESSEDETAELPPKETEEMIDLIADGTFLYTIVRPDGASQLNIRAAVTINNYIKSLGIDAKISDWGDKGIETPEILVGITKFFPEEAIDGIDLSRLGPNGFLIRTYGGKIIIAGANDKALLDAADYFIKNYLDIVGGKTKMPKDLFYISSNGLFLSDLTLNGCPLTDYTVIADEGAEDARKDLIELFNGKSAVKVADNGNKFINLKIDPSVGDIISSKFEEGNLVIRAKDAEAMKKAVVCFWYENIAYSIGTFDLSGSLDYKRDLSKTVFYSDFDVVQSESVCCREQLYDVHAYANEKGYKVFADYGAKYYISSVGRSVIINTDVEWGNASFTIDDSEVTPDKRGNWIFTLLERSDSYSIDTIKTLSRDMTNLGVTFPESSMVTFYDDTKRQYVRYGGNADNGQVKQDTVVVDKNGNIDPDAPFMWDFDNITSITVLPIDEELRTIGGGIFTTIANKAPSEYTYYARGLKVNRSNTLVRGVTHYIIGEGPTGAPYNGFLSINKCAYVKISDCVFTGHKTYQSPTTAMGSYDIAMANSISVSFINCTQANDINNSKYWGVSGTNYCKNFVYDGCVLSRFDAHKGVANGAIKNSVIGHAGASIIGYGTFLIENSSFTTNKMINLRSDYGSSWEGDIIIRNSSISPKSGGDVHVIAGSNKCNHDFGYVCYMPTNVIIEGLTADTTGNVYVFANLNSECKSDNYVQQYPYVVTEKVTVTNYTANSKNELLLSPNNFLFSKTEFNVDE